MTTADAITFGKANPSFPQAKWIEFEHSVFNLTGNFARRVDLLEARVIGGTSLILDHAGELEKYSMNESIYWTPRPFPFRRTKDPETRKLVIDERASMLQYMVNQMLSQKHSKIKHADPCVIHLCHPFGWYAYGHLHDTLQKIFYMRESNELKSCKFAVSDFKKIVDFKVHLSAVTRRKIRDHDLIQVKKHEIHCFPRLIVLGNPSIPTNYTEKTHKWITDGYARLSSNQINRLDCESHRLYLSRNHVQQGRRGVLNEEEVVSFLASQGFKIVNGSESLAEIISLFGHATHIVGAHGSLFANTIFCPPRTRILEFCPSNRRDYSFRDKYKSALFYQHQLVEGDSLFNINIPISSLKAFIKGGGVRSSAPGRVIR